MSCENLAINGKTPSIRKKYTERKGPPYSAPDCQNEYKQGNDGLWYQSTKNSAGIWTWRKTPDYAPHVPSPVPLPVPPSDEIYTYEMVVLPKLLNCAYSDSVYTQLDRLDQLKVVEWFKTYAPYAVDTFTDIINSVGIKETESHNGILFVITGPKDKAEIMESMIPEMLRDPDDDGNYPLNFYYPGGDDEIDCLVTSDIVSAGFVKSFVEPSPEPTPEPLPQPIPRKKTVAEWRKECKEMGMVYDPELKDCRPSKRGGQQVAPPMPMPIPAGKKKTIAEMRKECKDKGMVYDPTLKDCRPSKRVGVNPEVKKLYQENMAILEKLRINIENASKSADPIGILTEYKTLLEPMV